jgi:hypothetical protein
LPLTLCPKNLPFAKISPPQYDVSVEASANASSAKRCFYERANLRPITITFVNIKN